MVELAYLDEPAINPFRFFLRESPFGVEAVDTIVFSTNRVRAALLMTDYIAHLTEKGRDAEASRAAEAILLAISILLAELPQSSQLYNCPHRPLSSSRQRQF